MNLKKIAGALLCTSFLLTGCSSGGKSVDGKSVAVSTKQGNVFADDLYEKLNSGSNGENALFSYILDELIDAKYPATDAMKENAEEMYENILASYQSQYDADTYEEQLESDLKNYGYKDSNDYKNKLIYSFQYAEMIKKYVKENFDDVFDDYYKMAKPRKLSIIKISVADMDNPTKTEKANLQEVKDLLKEGEDFGSVAKKYSDDTDTKDAKGSLGIIDSSNNLSDTYGSDVATKAMDLTNGETSGTIKGTDGYYILHCDTTKKKTIKKEMKTVDIQSPLLTYDDYIVYLAYNTYNIEYKDKTVKKTITNFVKEKLEEREKERK